MKNYWEIWKVNSLKVSSDISSFFVCDKTLKLKTFLYVPFVACVHITKPIEALNTELFRKYYTELSSNLVWGIIITQERTSIFTWLKHNLLTWHCEFPKHQVTVPTASWNTHWLTSKPRKHCVMRPGINLRPTEICYVTNNTEKLINIFVNTLCGH